MKNNFQLSAFNAQLPKGWEVKRLGEVCEILDNLRKPITKRDRVDGDYPYYGATGILSYINDYIFNEKLVLIGEDGAKWFSGANSSFIVKGKYWVNNHAHVIRPNRSIVLDKWIVYFLNFSDLTEFVTGMTVPKLNQGNLKQIKIPLPSLSTQKYIVTILDKAFAEIAKAETIAKTNLQNAKELFESYLDNVFKNKSDDWEEKTLGEVCVKAESVNPKLNPKKKFVYIDVSSVNKETKIIEKITILLGKDMPSRARKLIKTNDIIFATVRPTHQRITLIPNKYNNQVCSTGYYVFRPKNILNSSIIYYFLLTCDFNKEMERLQKGASYPAVTNKEVESQTIFFPRSLEKQKKIVQKLNQLQVKSKKLEAIYRQKILNLEELKKSILQKAFSGRLL